MLDRVDREVNIEVGPVQVMGLWPLEVEDRFYRRFREPREFRERHEELAIVNEQPDAVPRDVRDLSCRNGRSRHSRSPDGAA
jgi:hypothetical protein